MEAITHKDFNNEIYNVVIKSYELTQSFPLAGQFDSHLQVQSTFYSGSGFATDISNLQFCTWWGQYCYWSSGSSSPSSWLILLIPYQAVTYLAQILYVTILYINSYIDIVNLAIFNSGYSKTIPYAYWYFATINLLGALFFLLSGMAVGTFCYFDTFDPDFK